MGSNENDTTIAQAEAAGPANRNPRGIYKGTREEWLEEAMTIMGHWLNDVVQKPCLDKLRNGPMIPRGHKKGDKLLSIAQYHAKRENRRPSEFKFKQSDVKVSCSLLSAGMNHGPALAHVHLKHATGNKKHEIRMGAHIGGRKTRESSSRIADILLHEMIHTMFPFHGHRGGFAHVAHSVGLNAPMTATTPSPALRERIDNHVVKVLGRYPHAGVKLVPRGKRGKGSRLKKCQCPNCGCVIRLTRKWISIAEEEQGYVACPACMTGMEVEY